MAGPRTRPKTTSTTSTRAKRKAAPSQPAKKAGTTKARGTKASSRASAPGADPKASSTLAGAVRDLTSDAYLAVLASASPREVDALLEGVVWERPRSLVEEGKLVGGAVFASRGAGASAMAARRCAFVAHAPGGAAERLRASVKSLEIVGDAQRPTDIAFLARFPSLETVTVSDAARLDGSHGMRSLRKITVRRVGVVDPSTLSSSSESELAIFDAGSIRGLAAARARELTLMPAPRGTDLTKVGATSLTVRPPLDESSIGPIGGSLSRLAVSGPALARVVLGALPRLETLTVSAPRTLREIVGLDASVPLRELRLQGPLTSLEVLAAAPGLHSLDLELTAPARALPGLEAIGTMREITSIKLMGGVPLGFLARLPELRHLKSLVLAKMELERIPPLAHFAPALEQVSLIGSTGFMEHDALVRLPKLKRLGLVGSTLASRRSQIDRRLAAAGVEIVT